MIKLTANLFKIVLLAILVVPMSSYAQESGDKPPTKSQEQAMNKRNFVPKDFKTEIIICDESDRKRAEDLIKVYKILEDEPTHENLLPYIADNYIQHSTSVPDGRMPLSMVFSATVAEYPCEIDVHKIIVVGDWAVAHVNFRRMDTSEPDDLGIAAVDMYYFGPDGRIQEHWDVLQTVPTFSVNPNGMFLKHFKE